MSAENFIQIDGKTFEVRDKCASCPENKGRLIGVGKNLKDAIKIAQEEELEYGIMFVNFVNI